MGLVPSRRASGEGGCGLCQLNGMRYQQLQGVGLTPDKSVTTIKKRRLGEIYLSPGERGMLEALRDSGEGVRGRTAIGGEVRRVLLLFRSWFV